MARKRAKGRLSTAETVTWADDYRGWLAELRKIDSTDRDAELSWLDIGELDAQAAVFRCLILSRISVKPPSKTPNKVDVASFRQQLMQLYFLAAFHAFEPVPQEVTDIWRSVNRQPFQLGPLTSASAHEAAFKIAKTVSIALVGPLPDTSISPERMAECIRENVTAISDTQLMTNARKFFTKEFGLCLRHGRELIESLRIEASAFRQADKTVQRTMTAPMTVSELAPYFGMHRNQMAKKLPSINGAQKSGSRWQLPISEMPVEYHVKKGTLGPQQQ